MFNSITDEFGKYAGIVYDLEKTVEYSRLFLDRLAIERLNRVFPELADVCKECIDEDITLGKQMWDVTKALTSVDGDLVSIGDHIELLLLPLLKTFIERKCSFNEALNDKYVVKSTASGFLTLYAKDKNIYLHSNNDPMFSEMKYVRSFYDETKKVYYVYGAGLGYLPYQIWDVSEGYTKIKLFEPNDAIYNAALEYGVLSKIPPEKIERVNYNNVHGFLQAAEAENAGVMIHVPSANLIDDEIEKRELLSHWILLNTNRIHDDGWSYNRARNKVANLPNAELMVKNMQSREVVVVAAGPSLTDHLEEIRSWRGEKKIVVVGHAFHKLIDEGIVPDCVVIIDHLKGMMDQVRGIDKMGIPLLVGGDAYWGLAQSYKDVAFSIDDWNYGGTVASAAIEVAIKMNADTIYLTGLDLGYPIHQSHADGIEGQDVLESDKLFAVASSDGGEVLTDKQLDYYRKQIQIQISNHNSIKFYNMSEHGAKIEGAYLWNSRH